MHSFGYLVGLTALATGGTTLSITDTPVTTATPPMAMNLVITAANAAICDFDYSRTAGAIRIDEKQDGTTQIIFQVRHAVPEHLYSVWLRLVEPSPLSGAPATPLAAMSDLQTIIDNADTASAAGANAFYTNAAGNATLIIDLDYHLSDGIVPFSAFDPSLADGLVATDAPFTFRMVSHCIDGLQGGLLPGGEPTFEFTLN